MSEQELMNELRKEPTYLRVMLKGDAGICILCRFMFTFAILSDCTKDGYGDRWCYSTYDKARMAMEKWNGVEGTEPTGWHRHPASGRRVDLVTGEIYVSF